MTDDDRRKVSAKCYLSGRQHDSVVSTTAGPSETVRRVVMRRGDGKDQLEEKKKKK